MITGLTKNQKTTSIFFDEHSSTVEILTHNSDLKKQLKKMRVSTPICAGRPMTTAKADLNLKLKKADSASA